MFRNAVTDDAAFILGLRTDEQKSRYLSNASPDLEQQRAWLEAYAAKTDQAYFIIENSNGEPLGTVRLYDPQGISFCWGIWILKAGAPAHTSIESAIMVYAYAIDHLGYQQAHFDVRKGNEHVWRFHERFGAVRAGETEHDYLYRLDASAITASRRRYRKHLPDPPMIEE